MGVKITNFFEYGATHPLDSRDEFATLADMRAYNTAFVNEGHITFCKADGKRYEYLSTNSVDATTGKWREYKVSGGGSAGYFVEQNNTSLPSGTAPITVTESSITELSKNLTLFLKLKYTIGNNRNLRINSLSSKPIVFRGEPTKVGLAQPGDIVTLVYDGTSFIVTSIDRVVDNSTFYGTCSTASDDNIKVIRVPANYTTQSGNIIAITFINAINQSAAETQLRLQTNETPSRIIHTLPVYYEGQKSPIPVEAAQTAMFIYQEDKYELVGATSAAPDNITVVGADEWLSGDDESVPTVMAVEQIFDEMLRTNTANIGDYNQAGSTPYKYLYPNVDDVKSMLDTRVRVLTEAEYDALATKKSTTIYLIKEG